MPHHSLGQLDRMPRLSRLLHVWACHIVDLGAMKKFDLLTGLSRDFSHLPYTLALPEIAALTARFRGLRLAPVRRSERC